MKKSYSLNKDEINLKLKDFKELEGTETLEKVKADFSEIRKIRITLTKDKAEILKEVTELRDSVTAEYNELTKESAILEAEYKSFIDKVKQEKLLKARKDLIPSKQQFLKHNGYDMKSSEEIEKMTDMDWVDYITMQDKLKRVTEEFVESMNNTPEKTNSKEVEKSDFFLTQLRDSTTRMSNFSVKLEGSNQEWYAKDDDVEQWLIENFYYPSNDYLILKEENKELKMYGLTKTLKLKIK